MIEKSKTIRVLTSAALLLAIAGFGNTSAQELDRTVLPIQAPVYPAITELNARKAEAPPRFEIKAPEGIVRANSVTLPKRQNRISRPLIFLFFPGRSERFDGRSKYLEFCSDNAP